MSDKPTIDLALIELRCRLRGWRLFRYKDGTIDIRGELGVYVANFYDGVWAGSEWKLMESPRLTLAAIIADPGEGWTVRQDPGLHKPWHFRWERGPFVPNGAGGLSTISGILAIVTVKSAGWPVDDPQYRQNSSREEYVLAHRAVTELLIRLAEVAL